MGPFLFGRMWLTVIGGYGSGNYVIKDRAVPSGCFGGIDLFYCPCHAGIWNIFSM